jgi:superfamily II DNA/RNA helicase
MSVTFAQLGLPQPLVNALAKRDITEPFPVQAATIPDALAGRDVSGKAPTGSGKTLAFGLPLLARVAPAARQRPRALILAPTRELAEQIKRELQPVANAAHRRISALYGGVRYSGQKNALNKGVDVLVATPGRLEDLIEQRALELKHVEFVVIDEADRMADMGFMPAVRRILDQTSKRRQTLLFSATLDGDIAVLSRDYQRDPVRHEAGTIEPETIDARHHFWLVQHDDRVRHTAEVVDMAGRSIVFTRTRHGADRLARQLAKLGVGAVAMHGGRSQNQRTKALQAFSSGKAQALIATDVAARGIHIDAVASVVHFDPPADHKDYLHRSGRTARAGATGTVVSLVTHQQKRAVGRMQRNLNLQVPIESPEFGDLHNGGHRMGASVSSSPRRNGSSGQERRPAGQNHAASPRREAAAPTRRETTQPETRRPAAPTHRPARGADKAAESIYVANLPWDVDEDGLAAMFSRFGEVRQATLITDRRSGRSKGFGFVDMSEGPARAAIKELNGSRVGGRDLTVRFAKPRTWGADGSKAARGRSRQRA